MQLKQVITVQDRVMSLDTNMWSTRHFVRDCCRRQLAGSQRSSKGFTQCYSCQGFGHVARNCVNNFSLNEQGVHSPVGMMPTPRR